VQNEIFPPGFVLRLVSLIIPYIVDSNLWQSFWFVQSRLKELFF